MESLLQFGLANAAAAALLAIVVATVTRFWRNPYVAHVLWAIVLLRLVAPPMLQIPFRTPEWFARQPAATQPPTLSEIANLEPAAASPAKYADSLPVPRPAAVPDGDLIGASHDPPAPLAVPLGRVALKTKASTPPIPQPSFARSIRFLDVLGGVWIAGTVFYVAVTVVRVRSFARALRRSQCPASGWLEQEIGDIAKSIGLRRAPRLMVVDGPLPPMVWSGWRPTLLVPQRIVESIDPRQRRLLLLHELLHLRRGDNRVRWFAVAVLALYWWNPFAWWAVRRLQNAEEECCDAAVLSFHPHQSEIYGEALLAVSEFVSCGSLPAAAVSIGVERKNHLKRRMTMILKGSNWPRLSGPRLAAVIGCGALAIGVSLTTAAAQVEPAGSARTGADSGKSSTLSARPVSNSPNSVTPKPNGRPVRPRAASPRPRQRPAPPATLPDLSEDLFIKILPGDDETQRMLKERNNAAIRGLQLSEYQHEVGTANVALVLSAARSVLEARLALAKTPEEQIRARQDYLDLVTSYWKEAKAKLDIGGAAGFDPLEEAQAREAMYDAKLKLAEASPAKSAKESETSRPGSPGAASVPGAPVPGSSSVPAQPLRTAAERAPERLPALLTAKPLELAAGDDEVQRLLKARYNLALKWLQASYARTQMDPNIHLTTVVTAARSLLDAELATVTPPDSAKVYRRYLELWKHLDDVAEQRWKNGSLGSDEVSAVREARLDAEIKFVQEKRDAQASAERSRTWIQALEANVRIAKAEVEAAEAGVDQARADLRRAEANFTFHNRTFNRQQALVQKAGGAEQSLDESRRDRDADAANIEGATAAIRAAQAQAGIKRALLEKAQAELADGKANLEK
jgi:beta-lactamase regulating signal transducer with metallopeptidase domain